MLDQVMQRKPYLMTIFMAVEVGRNFRRRAKERLFEERKFEGF